MINPTHITKLKLLYDVELIKQIGGYQKPKHFFFNRINLKAEHELSCFIVCHLGEIEVSHKSVLTLCKLRGYTFNLMYIITQQCFNSPHSKVIM